MLRLARLAAFAACALLVAAVPASAQDGPGDLKAEVGPERAKSGGAAHVAVLGGAVTCTNGTAAGYACSGVDLLSYTPLSGLGVGIGQELNDIWGWTDPETGQEWALVARTDGTSFVDVTDPENPRYAGQVGLMPGTTPSSWRDVKVYQNHAYIVADSRAGNGVQVFDLTRLRTATGDPQTFSTDALYQGVQEVHNIAINEVTGFAYAIGLSAGNGNPCGRGIHILDLSTPDDPTFAGCAGDPRLGRGYVHDAQCVSYTGPDADYSGREICFNSGEAGIGIEDVTEKGAPVVISRASYPSANYVHQGWLTRDHRYFIQNDELDELRGATAGRTLTFVWDVEDLDEPVIVATFENNLNAIDHNLYVKGDLVFQANYTAGLRLLDISDKAAPKEVGFFDTTPNRTGISFDGTWSVYPYFESGTIVVSSIGEGLFVLKLDDALSVTSADSAGEVPSSLRIETVFPNPVRQSATLTLAVAEAGPVNVAVYDATGRRVATLHDGVLPEGTRSFTLDASGLTAGTYLVRASAGAAQVTRSITVVR